MSNGKCAVGKLVSINTVILLLAAGAGAYVWTASPPIGAVAGGVAALVVLKML